MTGGYNGWTNRATWECAVGVFNSARTYIALLEEQPTTPKEAKVFCGNHGYAGNINWMEISEAFREEFDEVSLEQ